jgi:hypothetical protein
MNSNAIITMAVVIAIAMALTAGGGWIGITYASHGSSPAACEADGYEAGQDGPFSQELYETCKEVGGGDAYYQGFIEGCMDADNSREVCEQATDAG